MPEDKAKKNLWTVTWHKIASWYGAIVAILIAFALGFAYGGHALSLNPGYHPTPNAPQITNANAPVPDYLSKDVDFSLFWKVWQEAKTNYVDQPVSDTQLFYGALSGIVSSLNDPYSVFFDPKTAQDFQGELAGQFEGIGAEIGVKNDQLIIVAPLADTPADKAGLKPGDFITAIDGKDTAGMAVDVAVGMIRGKEGTKVKLSIFRTGFDKPQDFQITREKITVKSVKWEMKDNGVAYIDVSHFNDDTSDLFNQAVKELVTDKGAKKLVLDLRSDPGGFLDTAVDLGSHWIDTGDIVKERFSDGSIKEYKASGPSPLKNVKTVVLINEGSASASEILAGALQDDKLATLVGEKSFGKGSVQILENLDDGSAIKITVAKWLTPKDRTIDKDGIEPDVKVDITKADIDAGKDPQLDKALELLK